MDARNKMASTPAYMLAQRISEVFEGVSKVVQAVLDAA
jgi:enhancing lycopene biosynthesis protein 2